MSSSSQSDMNSHRRYMGHEFKWTLKTPVCLWAKLLQGCQPLRVCPWWVMDTFVVSCGQWTIKLPSIMFFSYSLFRQCCDDGDKYQSPVESDCLTISSSQTLSSMQARHASKHAPASHTHWQAQGQSQFCCLAKGLTARNGTWDLTSSPVVANSPFNCPGFEQANLVCLSNLYIDYLLPQSIT